MTYSSLDIEITSPFIPDTRFNNVIIETSFKLVSMTYSSLDIEITSLLIDSEIVNNGFIDTSFKLISIWSSIPEIDSTFSIINKMESLISFNVLFWIFSDKSFDSTMIVFKSIRVSEDTL